MPLEKNYSPSTFVDVLRFRAQNQPDQRAFTYLPDGESEGDSLTYRELDRQARNIASWLQSVCPKGERALLLYNSTLEFITAFFGCMYGGVIAVPAQPPGITRTLPRIQSIAVNAEVSLLLSSSNLPSKIERQLNSIPELASLVRQKTDKIADSFASTWQHPEITSETLALLQYTSGSTAAPKGVMVSHGNLIHNSALIQSMENNSSASVSGTWLPPFHDMGLIEAILQPVYSGYPCFMMPPMAFLQKPIRWLQMITKYKVTNSGGPNFAFDLCISKIRTEQCEGLDLSSWAVCYNGSEPIRKHTLDQFYEAFYPYGLRWQSICPVYGLAEATLAVSGGVGRTPTFLTVDSQVFKNNEVICAQPNEPDTQTLVSSGRLHRDSFEVIIVNPESHTRCKANRIGEIWLKSPSVAKGYWNRPEETTYIFHNYDPETGDAPFLRTGDLGFIEDDELFITGRSKDLIVITGQNHYPQDIELTAEQAHPALRSAGGCAFSIDQDGEERLVMVSEINREYIGRSDFEEIISAMRQAIAEEHGIRLWVVYFVKPGSIPKTSSGKIQRQRCKMQLKRGDLKVLAQGELEKT